MMDDPPVGVFLAQGWLTEEMRREIGRLLKEGMQPQDVAVAVGNMFNCPISYQLVNVPPSPIEAMRAYTDKYPTWPETVEGSIVEPITDEKRLLS